jgi:hypothetical protein
MGSLEQDMARIIASAIKTAIRPVEDRLTALEPGAPTPTAYGLSEFAKDLAVDTKGFVTKMIAEAVAPLQRRIAELEARPHALKYVGTWSPDAPVHEQGHAVTDKGSVWIAVTKTRGRPGECRDWQLAVKGAQR